MSICISSLTDCIPQGPASETMARSYVQHLASTNSSESAFTRSLLNESLWANLELGYKGRAEGAGRLPLDDILVGTSRVRVLASSSVSCVEC